MVTTPQKKSPPPGDPPRPPREILPTMYDLPSEDPKEPGLPDEFHIYQPDLLRRTCRTPRYAPSQMFTGSDLNLYYDVRHPLRYKRPDWFLVVGVSRFWDEIDIRSSYVMWQEGVAPLVIVELLSPGTAKEDLGENVAESEEVNGAIPSKWEVYEQILRVPYYIVYSRHTQQLRFFQLVGAQYQEQSLNADLPLIWIPELELGLGLWEGEYEGISHSWLRWCDRAGNWIPTDTETERLRTQEAQQQAQEAQQQVEAERLRTQEAQQQAQEAQKQAEAERLRAERLAERLRQMGIDPEAE